jgi:hypothetical protein
MKKLVEEYYCDWCGDEIKNPSIQIINGEIYDVCSNCIEKLKIITTWKESKNKYITLNMNQPIKVCLGKDAAESYNDYIKRFSDTRVKEGDEKEFQFYSFLEYCSDSFRKGRGCQQDIAHPFEIQIQLSGLYLK